MFNSSSLRTANSKSRILILILLLSFADVEAFSKISDVKYSRAPAKYTGAKLVTITLEYPKLRRNFSVIAGANKMPAFSCLLVPLILSSFPKLRTAFSAWVIALIANWPGKTKIRAFFTSFSDIVFFFAISVKVITVVDIKREIKQSALFNCCLEFEVIPFVSDTCFRTLEI